MAKELIDNKDTVVAHTSDNNIHTWKMGALKEAFISKKLPYVVTFLYHIKSNTNYFVTYAPTRGFRYEKRKD